MLDQTIIDASLICNAVEQILKVPAGVPRALVQAVASRTHEAQHRTPNHKRQIDEQLVAAIGGRHYHLDDLGRYPRSRIYFATILLFEIGDGDYSGESIELAIEWLREHSLFAKYLGKGHDFGATPRYEEQSGMRFQRLMGWLQEQAKKDMKNDQHPHP